MFLSKTLKKQNKTNQKNMSNLPLSLKTPGANNTTTTPRAPDPNNKPSASRPSEGTAAVSQNIAAIVNLPASAKPEVLSRSGHETILRVGTSVMSVSGLKQDYQTVQRHIGFERERRLEAEKLYAVESESLLDKEQAEAVARREEELARLHEERTSMIEFLKRGTDEAKRISADVLTLKTRANEKEIEEADLSQERSHLDGLLDRLNQELEDHKHQLQTLSRSKDQMEQRQAELNALANSTEQQSTDLESKLDILKRELDSRLIAARRVEQLESSMAVISAASRRLQHELEHINTNVVRISDDRLANLNSTDSAQIMGNLDAELEAATIAPEFDSEVEAEDTRITSVVGATARTKFARCSSIIKAMLTALLRYDMEIAARLVKNKKQHEEAVNGAHKYLRETRQKIEEEMERWNQKYRQREDQLRKANDFRNRAVTETLKQHEEAMIHDAAANDDDDDHAPKKSVTGVLAAEKALLESSFSLTQYFERIMNETAQERNLVLSENQKLKQKVEKYSRDYQLVKELRNQYREMETQKISLESTLRAAEEENRQLKMLMTGEGGDAGTSSRGPGDGNVFAAIVGGGADGDENNFGGGVGPGSRITNTNRRKGVAGSRQPVWRSNTFN